MLGMYVVTATLKMENQQGPPTAQGALLCYVAAWMGGGLGGDWMAESLRCSPETMTTLLISYISIQNKKLKTKRMDVYFMTLGAPEGSGSLCTPCSYSQPLVWGQLQTAICCFCCPGEGRHPGLPCPEQANSQRTAKSGTCATSGRARIRCCGGERLAFPLPPTLMCISQRCEMV